MGSVIHVNKGAILELGDNFAISGCSTINCYKHIIMGNDIQFSWDCLVMDSDTHSIFDKKGNLINEPKEIILEDRIWIGCGTTILKGTHVPANCIVGASSVVTGTNYLKNSIIAGVPAKSLKEIGYWEL